MEMRARKAAARGKQVARPAAEMPKVKPAETAATTAGTTAGSKVKLADTKVKPADKKATQSTHSTKEELEAKAKLQAAGTGEAKPAEEEDT